MWLASICLIIALLPDSSNFYANSTIISPDIKEEIIDEWLFRTWKIPACPGSETDTTFPSNILFVGVITFNSMI